ncbi:ankyrin repeat-containing domain protein [Aspergillus insuetus]
MRKRRAEGKESDVTMRGRKFTKQEVDKEIARHVRLREQWYTSEGTVLPDYITVSAPTKGRIRVVRRDLLRNLPCYLYAQQIEAVGFSDPLTQTDRIQSFTDLPRLRAVSHCDWTNDPDIDEYLPPEWPTAGVSDSRTIAKRNLSSSVLRDFFQRFVFLATNKRLPDWEFRAAYNWIVDKLGTDALLLLCRSETPSMRVFARRIFCSAVESGDAHLTTRLMECDAIFWDDHICTHQLGADCLSSAIYHGHTEIVTLLCEGGVPPKISNRRSSWTLKSWDFRFPILQTLLASGAHPDTFITDREPGFPLVNAAHDGCLPAVKLLIQTCARHDHFLPREVAIYLINCRADKDVPPVTSLSLSNQDLCCALKMGSLQTPIQIAAKRNNITLVRTLLERGASFKPFLPGEHWLENGRYLPDYTTESLIHTSIQYAAIKHNLEMAELLLSRGVDPDSRIATGLGDTALQISARLANPDMFRLLLSSGADIRAPPGTFNGRTALQGAAESGDFEILSIIQGLDLISALINAPPGKKSGMTALQAACLNGHPAFAGALLAHGADINAFPSPLGGCTALQAAAWNDNVQFIQDLLTLGANVGALGEASGTSALLASVKHKSLRLLQLMVQNGVDVNRSTDGGIYTPIQKAASVNWLAGVEFLLEHGANVNDLAISAEDEDIQSPLGWAITNDSEDMVLLLLQHGADILAPVKSDGTETKSALVHALQRNASLPTLKLLLSWAPNLDRHPGWLDVVQLAIHRCDNATVDLILSKALSMPPPLCQDAIQKAWDSLPNSEYLEKEETCEVSVDGRAQNGSTLLQRICRAALYDGCRVLIEHGASVDLNTTESYGTPLQEALRSRDVWSANLLLDHGADINALPARMDGLTALQAGAMNGMFKMVIRFLESGADVAAPAALIRGKTAIDGAAERGHWDMVQLLLNAYETQGVEAEQACSQAADRAERKGHTELTEWLRGYSRSGHSGYAT